MQPLSINQAGDQNKYNKNNGNHFPTSPVCTVQKTRCFTTTQLLQSKPMREHAAKITMHHNSTNTHQKEPLNAIMTNLQLESRMEDDRDLFS
ncbi:hypothetical protein E2C01_016335 [Portunus trituberculatus]|uniref:Uncharacterized protein n=1 Tax=Portunus trituberculatus TaxID=210409 RepID=A0A5B7DQM9_PORTR|nr:hypothetical protein [Portunus trituberculatus]